MNQAATRLNIASIVLNAIATAFPKVAARLRIANTSFRKILCLRYIASHVDPVCMTDIARWAHFSTAAATGLVDALEKEGLVERHERPGNRRERVVALTAKGSELLENVEAALAAHFQEVGLAQTLAALASPTHAPAQRVRSVLPPRGKAPRKAA